MPTVTEMDSQHFLRWKVLSGVLCVSLVLTPGFPVGREIKIAGIVKPWWDDIISALLLASCLLIIVGLMAGSIKKLFDLPVFSAVRVTRYTTSRNTGASARTGTGLVGLYPGPACRCKGLTCYA